MKKKLAVILCVASAAIMSSGYENYIQEDEIVSIQQAEEYKLEITDTTGTESVYEVCMKNGEKLMISRQYVPDLKRKLGLKG